MTSEAPEFILDASEENFNELVIQNSSRGPVLVNYWSKKVGPCIRQYPVLETLVSEFTGRFLLVNINTDEHRSLAKEYGVTSLPTLKLFVQGEVAATRHGYQDLQDLKSLMTQYLPRESDRKLTRAVRLYQQGDAQQALVILAKAVMDDPGNLRLPHTMARLMVNEGQVDEAIRLLQNMPPEQRNEESTRLLLGELGLWQVAGQAPSDEELDRIIDSEPGNLTAPYQRAARLFVAEDYADCLEQLLAVHEQDREFNEGAARKAMMTVFAMLGDDHQLVETYRERLQRLY